MTRTYIHRQTQTKFHLPPHSQLLEHWDGDVAPYNTPKDSKIDHKFTDMREVARRLENGKSENKTGVLLHQG